MLKISTSTLVYHANSFIYKTVKSITKIELVLVEICQLGLHLKNLFYLKQGRSFASPYLKSIFTIWPFCILTATKSPGLNEIPAALVLITVVSSSPLSSKMVNSCPAS